MNPLGKKIVVYGMAWVLIVMIMSQIYDNVRGKGMPVQTVAVPTAVAVVTPDAEISRLAELQNCVASDPENAQCTVELAAIYYAAKQWPQAQVNYERAVKLDSHNVQSLLKLSGTYIFQQKFDEAVTTLQQAAVLSPDSAEIHLLLGLSLSKVNPTRMDEAVKEWKSVIDLAPETTWAKQAQQYINESGNGN